VAPEQAVDPVERYRTWITAFSAFLLLTGLVTVAFAFPGLYGPVALVGAIMGMVIEGMVLLALDTRRSWALDAATRICVIVIVLGVLRTLLDLAFGRLNIPIDVIAGFAVLSKRPQTGSLPRLAPADRQTAVLVAAGFLAAASLPIVAVIAQVPMVR
jgi:hypothetical protein